MSVEPHTVEIVPAASFAERFPNISLTQVSLYSQPWFMQAVASGKGYYAHISLDNKPETTTIFPFCGQKIGWKWRLFQPSFCQRFQAFSIDNQQIDDTIWKCWFSFLEKNTWTGHWPFEIAETGQNVFSASSRIAKKTNYIFPLLVEMDEMLAKWKPGRRNTLKKATSISIAHVNASDFIEEVLSFSKDGEVHWRPSAKETSILRKLINSTEKEALTYRIAYNSETVAMALILKWGNRLHYLMGMSNTEGLRLEAMPFFFKELMAEWRGSGKTIDFEGSSLPGVAAFFRSMGAEEELYGLWTK